MAKDNKIPIQKTRGRAKGSRSMRYASTEQQEASIRKAVKAEIEEVPSRTGENMKKNPLRKKIVRDSFVRIYEGESAKAGYVVKIKEDGIFIKTNRDICPDLSDCVWWSNEVLNAHLKEVS